mmetsp:Transcript_5229/g.16517  ORF Transcript_5229/g.16517 Transcript_5229/m.16517 type:complete len:230 (+) Transcript_5229:53-742(+)
MGHTCTGTHGTCSPSRERNPPSSSGSKRNARHRRTSTPGKSTCPPVSRRRKKLSNALLVMLLPRSTTRCQTPSWSAAPGAGQASYEPQATFIPQKMATSSSMVFHGSPDSSALSGGASAGGLPGASTGQYTMRMRSFRGRMTRQTAQTVKRNPPKQRRDSEPRSTSLIVAAARERNDVRRGPSPTCAFISVIGCRPPLAMRKAMSRTPKLSPQALRMLFARPLPLPPGM